MLSIEMYCSTGGEGGDVGSVKISPLMANIICFLMANEATGDSKRENYPRLQQWKDDCATAAATITRRYRRHHPKLELLRSAKSERANERAPSTSRRVIPFRFFPPSVVATHDATSDRTKYGERASLCCRFCVALSMEGDLNVREKFIPPGRERVNGIRSFARPGFDGHAHA